MNKPYIIEDTQGRKKDKTTVVKENIMEVVMLGLKFVWRTGYRDVNMEDHCQMAQNEQ